MNKSLKIRLLLTLLFLAILLGVSACVPVKGISTDPMNPNSEAFILKPKVINSRFETKPTANSFQSSGLWIRQGEKISVRWDEFSVFINDYGITCDFESPSQRCQRCNACTGAANSIPSFCPLNGKTFPFLQESLPLTQLYTFPGFTSQLPPSEIKNIQESAGCGDGSEITPTTNAAFQLKFNPNFFDNKPVNEIESLAESRVHIINTDGMESIIYELSSLSQQDSSDTLKYFSGTVPLGRNGVLHDNFSSTLFIGKIRILKGIPNTNPATGDFSLTDFSVVKPSRVVFISRFTEDQQVSQNDRVRCYANYKLTPVGNPDGNLDMSKCRFDVNNSSTIRNEPAKPVSLEADPNGLLTWAVEFNQSDFATIGGGEIPSLEAGQVLAIEFTIR